MLYVLLGIWLFIGQSAAETVLHAEVIVIGAGVAGLKAAYDLNNTYKRSVIVLEARSRPYGRVDTVKPEGWPISIERGAQWFHGNTAANPVYTYATKTLKVPTVISDGNDVTFDGSSSASSAPLVDFETKRKWNALFNDFASELKDYYQQNWPKGRVTSSLGDALTSYATENDISGRDELALRERIDTNYVQEYAASPDKLSLWYFDADKKIAGEDAITNDGYNTVFNSIYDNLAAANAVRLGAAVTKVTRGSSGVQVTTSQGKFTANYVISTLPLGVLKSHYKTLFEPSLVNTKQAQAIESLGSGLLNKVVMLFNSDFWTSKVGENTEWIDRVPANWDGVQWTEFFSLKRATKQNILVAFQAGNSAITAERLFDTQLITSVMQSLRTMFGNNIPNVTKYVITRWLTDPYALGSYSYVKAGAGANARKELCANVERLYWAGEACSEEYPATVQGAWLTGEKAARDVARKLNRLRH